MVRYKPSQFTKKELEIMVAALAVDSGLDFLTGGKLNKYKRKAALAIYRSVVRPVATRAAIPAAASVGRAAFGASRLLMTNPYVLGGTAIYVGYQERERIKQLLDQGYQIVEEQVAPPVQRGISEVLDITAPGRAELMEGIGGRRLPVPEIFRPRKASKFNLAVSAGMKAVKKSTRYGGKGKIRPAKKVFAMVTKLAAAKKKKKKAPKSGIRRTIWNAMKRLR
jgi:hypothetical protein